MTRLQQTALLFLTNIIGFFSPAFCYYLGVITGRISSSNPDFNPAIFKAWFFPSILMTWIVCAIFSLSFFYIKDRGRWFFLCAPALIPIAYGLSVL